MFRRKLRPSRLPNPVQDAHSEAFFSGIGIGAVLAISAMVILWQSGVFPRR
jgi:hypothetical protein